MPSPFSNTQTVETSDVVQVTDSNLYCERCGDLTTDGQYNTKEQKLTWDCYDCGWKNVVKDIEL